MVNNDKHQPQEDEHTTADNTVVQKYKTAGTIVNSEYRGLTGLGIGRNLGPIPDLLAGGQLFG